jgi:uncharacterized membrane protein (DUF373 family)
MLSKDRTLNIAEKISALAEILLAGLLLFILFMGLGSFVVQAFTSFSQEVYTIDAIKNLIDKALILFIILELYMITISYLKREVVIREVFVAAFLAIGRKILLYDYKAWGLKGSLALGFLLLAISFSYFLVEKIIFNGGRKA